MFKRSLKSGLRIVGRQYAPWVTECFHQSNCTERGIEFEFLDRSLKILGYRNSKYLKADSYDGRIEMLKNGTADISVNTEQLSNALKQSNAIGMTVVVCQDKLIYWIKDAMAANSSVVFGVCDWQVWLLVAVLVTSVISLRLVYKFNRNNKESGFEVSHFTTKGTNYAWWLVLGIFLGVYANLLAIALSIPPKAPLPFKDLEDLSYKLKSGKCRIIVAGAEIDIPPGEGVLATVVPNNQSNVPPGIRKRLLEAYGTNPPKFVGTHDEMIADIRSKDCYIGIDYFLGHPLMQAKYCGVKWIDDELALKASYVIIYRKELTETLGHELGALLTVGSPSDLYSRTVTRTAMRQAIGCPAQDQNHPLDMGELYEIFSMLIVAAAVGMVLCIKEKVLYNYSQKEEKENSAIEENDYSMSSTHKFPIDEHFMW